MDMPGALDAIDTKILEILQRDASLSTADLAEQVGLSQSPCWRRIQRLREEGYIKGTVALVDCQKLGFAIQIFAQLKMIPLSDEDRASFHRAVEAIPEITESYAVFGEMDAMLKVLAPDLSWYQDFVVSTILKLPGVADIRSIVTLAASKHTTAAPLHVRPLR